MIASMLSYFLFIWIIWAIIYLASRYSPISQRGELEIIQDIRDRMVRHGIFTKDDVSAFGYPSLNMSVLRVWNFLFYTIVLSLITVDVFYIWSG